MNGDLWQTHDIIRKVFTGEITTKTFLPLLETSEEYFASCFRVAFLYVNDTPADQVDYNKFLDLIHDGANALGSLREVHIDYLMCSMYLFSLSLVK